MATKSQLVSVNPAVLKWARESSGWSLEEIAVDLNLDASFIHELEDGNSQPSLSLLKKLAFKYKRPLAAFLLPNPPKEKPLPLDFRVLPGESRALSRETLLTIRRARRHRELALELTETLEHNINNKIKYVGIKNDPEYVARLERKKIGIEIGFQKKARDPYQMLEVWRNALEEMGVLVFRYPMPIEDVRGFSLSETRLPVIVINSSDWIHGRIFTLFHEYGHLLINQSGICVPENYIGDTNTNVEYWCNRFAGAFLLPDEVFETDTDFQTILFEPSKLSKISKRYKVSMYVVAIRMFTRGMINSDEYQRLKAYLSSIPRDKPSFIPPTAPERRCVQEKGKLFTSLVVEGDNRGVLTRGDAIDYLSLQMNDFGKVRDLVGT